MSRIRIYSAPKETSIIVDESVISKELPLVIETINPGWITAALFLMTEEIYEASFPHNRNLAPTETEKCELSIFQDCDSPNHDIIGNVTFSSKENHLTTRQHGINQVSPFYIHSEQAGDGLTKIHNIIVYDASAK